MTVLADTHVLLWALLSPERLSQTVRDIIIDETTILLVSAASAWEIATKHRLGRLDEAGAVITGYADHLHTLRAEEVPITSQHGLLAGGFDGAHRDPFDRMIVAQSVVLDVAVLSNDRELDGLPGRRLW